MIGTDQHMLQTMTTLNLDKTPIPTCCSYDSTAAAGFTAIAGCCILDQLGAGGLNTQPSHAWRLATATTAVACVTAVTAVISEPAMSCYN